MRGRKLAVAAAGGTLGIVAASPVVAWADTVAPSGSATGSALTLSAGGNQVVAVSPTSATASGGGSGSSASVLEVGGQSVVPSPSDSSSNGSGSGPSSLVDTGPNSQGRLQVAPASATSSPAGSTTTSESDAALAKANLGGDSGLSAYVAHSHSKAQYTTNPDGSTTSSGKDSTDGAEIVAGGPGGLDLIVLHSEASQSGSGGGADSYILSINGQEIGKGSDVGQICSSISNPLLQLACATASGGNGSAGIPALASVLTGSAGGSGGLGLGLIGASAGGTPAGAHIASPGGSTATPITAAGGLGPAGPAGAPQLAGTPAGPGTATAARSGSLPFTGAPVDFLVFASLALLALGGVVVRVSTVVVPRYYS